MRPKKTVIVVGAGASKEADLPSGAELKSSIARDLDIRFAPHHPLEMISGDSIIAASLKTLSRDINPHLHACWKIRDALPQAMSIDDFIDSHRGSDKIELCGKLAIVRSILQAEKSSKLSLSRPNEYKDEKLNFVPLEGTWFNLFWQRISENCQAKDLEKRLSSITLIVFNYDRCIEYFIYHSIQNYYGLSADNAAALVNGMAIFHPYGMVGSLPWSDGTAYMEFGGEPNSEKLVGLAEQIKTFTEGTDPEASDIIEIRKRVAEASTLVFLGFAYHRQNLKLLAQPSERRDNERSAINTYGTTVDISSADLEVISSKLLELYNASLLPNENRNLTCQELFNTYRQTLSFV